MGRGTHKGPVRTAAPHDGCRKAAASRLLCSGNPKPGVCKGNLRKLCHSQIPGTQSRTSTSKPSSAFTGRLLCTGPSGHLTQTVSAGRQVPCGPQFPLQQNGIGSSHPRYTLRKETVLKGSPAGAWNHTVVRGLPYPHTPYSVKAMLTALSDQATLEKDAATLCLPQFPNL